MANVCWCSSTETKSLVNVGTDAVAMLVDNIVWLMDLKKRTRAYYKADSPSVGAGISRLVGHNRFPLFAIVEGVLRPSVIVIKYPELTKYAVFKTIKNTTYADICFSEHEYLTAITGYPFYKLRVWNIRTQRLIAEETTNKKSSSFSLLCSPTNVPRIIQFSQWHKEIICWDLCITSERTTIHEVSTLELGKEYTLSQLFSLCFGEDGALYIVNDYGSLSSVDIGQFYLKRHWNPAGNVWREPRRYMVFPHRQGVLISNSEMVCFVKRQAIGWAEEWVLKNMNYAKLISSYHGDAYAVNSVGNMYRLDAVDKDVAIVDFNVSNFSALDYSVLNGVREEVVLVLTASGTLRLVDMLRSYHYSTVNFPNGKFVRAHNLMPHVIAGNFAGQLYYISYEKVRYPIVLSVIEIAETFLSDGRLLDMQALVSDHSKCFHLVHTDYKAGIFKLIATIQAEVDIHILHEYLYGEDRFLLFITPELDTVTRYATHLRSYEWLHELKKMRCTEFDLPYKYCSIATPAVLHKESLEIYAIRLYDLLIDLLILHNNAELIITTTIKTAHISNILGISGGRNLVTWGVDGIVQHFRSHKKSTKPFIIMRYLQMCYVPRVMKTATECFNGKYLILLNRNGSLKCFKLFSTTDNLRENILLPDAYQVIIPKDIVDLDVKQSEEVIEYEHTKAELDLKADLEKTLEHLSTDVTKLIDYDISVTNRTQGVFRKFCLNHDWLDKLNNEAHILFETERNSLMVSINDQSRIRDWIMNLLTQNMTLFSIKLRGLFTNIIFESFGIRNKNMEEYYKIFDLYRFYDMHIPAEEGDDDVDDDDDDVQDKAKDTDSNGNAMKNMWVIEGNAYDHVMREEYFMQDKNVVTSNQMHSNAIKYRMILETRLKEEFNKIFVGVQKYKQEIMDNVINTNAVLRKIYSNMNCMLCLLKMETFEQPQLSVPVWMKDEAIESIITVDDSEIKSINRRKKKQIETAFKSGRMLLWASSFWKRALNVMMDGVLEKLWEEEIKKDIPIPEFMLKKQDHEYTLEDQKRLREYDETVRQLGEDRRKYLRILNENEQKTLDLKANHIHKINTKIAETALLKLKYDFAIKTGRMRVMNTKINIFKRNQHLKRANMLRTDIEKITEYIGKYAKLFDFWEKSVNDVKLKLEMLTARDKTIERDFKNKYLPTVSTHVTHEVIKLFKRRPKPISKSISSALVYAEMAARVTQKGKTVDFPLPNEIIEYFTALDELDHIQNMPNQMDPKQWEALVRLRRQKIETELKIKGTGVLLVDSQNSQNSFAKEVQALKQIKIDSTEHLEETIYDYFEAIQDRNLQMTLFMGQVEVSLGGALLNVSNSILMNVDDVNEVNEMIRKAGALKLKAMERVAFFRRQVIYKEWEHKVTSANINYLKYMLEIIGKCKVTMEFLHLLRNWNKVLEERSKATNSVGLIERVIEEKIAAYRKNLDRIVDKIAIVKKQIDEVKRRNQQINKQICDVKVSVAMSTANRDVMLEEKRERDRDERMRKITIHRNLLDTVREDYAHILELSTILELQRLRTFPTLAPAPSECP